METTKTETPAAPDPEQAPVVEVAPTPMKGALLGRIHDITEFASVDKTRYVINGLHFKPTPGKPGTGMLEATDGRILIQVPVTAPVDEFMSVADKTPATDCIIPVATFKKALSNVPKNGPLPILRHMRLGTEGDKITLSTTDLDTEQAVKTKAIEGQYPKTEQVIPKSEPTFSISLNPVLLAKICDYAAKHAYPKDASGSIKFMFTDAIDAVRFEIHVRTELGDPEKVTGILMPMRVA